MSMKNYKQLMEDAATNEELEKKLAEADRQVRKTGDKTVYIKAAAELGYEVTEQDFSGDDLVKLDDGQLDDVAGGLFGSGGEDENGKDLGCLFDWYKSVKSYKCPNSTSGKHKFINEHEEGGFKVYDCEYCDMKAYRR